MITQAWYSIKAVQFLHVGVCVQIRNRTHSTVNEYFTFHRQC